MELDDVRSRDLLDHFRKHVLGQIHQVVVVGIGHIKLAAGVLRVVSLINRLVSEVLADFENPVKTTDNALFQVELRGNSHVEFHIQVVVVGHKGSGCGTSRDHVHHGGLHLQESQIGQVLSHEPQNLGPGDEGLAGPAIHDQVKVSLPESRLVVLESDVRFRKHVQAGGQQEYFPWGN